MSATRHRRVLVVEDDDSIREMLELALADEGYEVLSAPNGAVALELLERAAPDVILLDMKMPVMDGWQFALNYQQRMCGQAPLIVFTAAQDPAVPAEEIAARHYLGKPFDLDDLLRAIEEL
jgi:two-component system, chemotaxis family, chemotaxis protein CheY